MTSVSTPQEGVQISKKYELMNDMNNKRAEMCSKTKVHSFTVLHPMKHN